MRVNQITRAGNLLGFSPGGDVIRSPKMSIQPAIPASLFTFLEARKLKFQRFPISIEDKVAKKTALRVLDADRQAVIFVAPALLIQADAMELDLQAGEYLVEGRELRIAQVWVRMQADGDQLLGEPMDIAVFFKPGPIQPANLIILTIGIVIALLAAPDLIAH